MKYVSIFTILFVYSLKISAENSQIVVDGYYSFQQAAAQQCQASIRAASGNLNTGCGNFSVPENNYYEHHWSEYVLLSNPNQGETSYGNFTCENVTTWHPNDVESCTQHNFVAQLEKDGCEEEGNPVDVMSGRKIQREVDYQPANNLFLPIKRTYKTVLNGVIHGKWTFEISPRLSATLLNNGDLDVFVRRINGRTLGFIGNTINGFTSDPGTTERLAHINGHFELTLNDDTVEAYGSNGRIETITRRGGYQLTYHYSDATSTEVIQISDSFGRTMDINYTNKLITSIINQAGQTFKYTYNSGGVIDSVIYPDDTPADDSDNPRKIYHYEIPPIQFPPNCIACINYYYPETLLTGITDENGNRFATYGYDGAYATSTEHAGGADRTTLDYDFLNKKVTVTNANDKQKIYHYSLINGGKKVTQVEGISTSDCAGGNKFISYDGNGFISSTTDHNGNVTTFTKDSRGLETSRTQAAATSEARSVTVTWHPTYRLPTHITKPGRTEDYIYDSNGNLLTYTETDTTEVCAGNPSLSQCKRITKYTYNNIGQALTIDGPRTDVSDITTFEYDSLGNRTKIINALNQVTEVTSFDSHGYPLSITDPNGNITDLTYDPRQRLITRTTAVGTPDEATTIFEYDAAGNVTKLTMPNGDSLNYIYDNAHRLIGIEDNIGNKIEYILDALGNQTVTLVKDPQNVLNYQQNALFDSLGRLVQEITSDNRITSHAYDLNSNLLVSTDAKGNSVVREYDALNRLIKAINPINSTNNPALYDYDKQNNLVSFTDTRGLVTTYQYNGFGDQISQLSPDTGLTTYTYDNAGNRTSQTDARGVTVNYSYDALHRLTFIDYPGTIEDITYTYDNPLNSSNSIRRLSQIIDQSGATEYEYDARGNLTIVKQTLFVNGTNQTYAMIYNYDLADSLISITYPSGRKIEYTRNSLKQITSVKSTYNSISQNITGNISYQPFAGIISMTAGNNLTESRNYDMSGRLIQKNISTLIDNTLTYDANNNIIEITNNFDANYNHSYTYDDLNRLTTAQNINGSFAYGYDGIGNRLQKTHDQTINNYAYGDDNHHLLDNDCIPPCQSGEVPAGPPASIAIGKPSQQSSTALGAVASHANDGNADGNFNNGSVSHTDYQYQSWWQVDLQENHELTEIVLYNRTDCCGNLLGNVYVLISENPFTTNDLATQLSRSDVTVHHIPGQVGTNYNVPISNTRGRYVRVQLDKTEFLVLAEVDVIGSALVQADTPFVYDAIGNLIQNRDITYNYNQQNRLSSATTPLGTTNYIYNAQGQRITKTLNDGSNLHYLYNESGLLITELDDIGNTIKEYAYLNGQPLSMMTPDNGNGSGSGGMIRLDEKVVRDGIVSLEHTGSGKPKKKNAIKLNSMGLITGSNGVEYSVWRIHNKQLLDETVTLADLSNNFSMSLTISAQSKTYIITDYLIEGGTLALYSLAQEEISNKKLNTELWVDEQLIEDENGGSSVAGGIYYYHNDHLGTPQLLTDQNQAIVWQASYNPFGEATITTGSIDNNLRFAGQYLDRETNLHYNFFRYYDPSIGRYITSDPIGIYSDPNTYAYVVSNPVRLIDPLGLWGSEPHHKIVENKYSKLPAQHRRQIEKGSQDVDVWYKQATGTHKHAMRKNYKQSIDKAKKLTCDFIKNEMKKYRKYMKRGKVSKAYRHLGRAMHPVMDSTSPVHRNWQVWHPIDEGVFHGNANGSLEGLDALTEELLEETLERMEQIENDNYCFCE